MEPFFSTSWNEASTDSLYIYDYYTYGIYGFVTFVGPFHLRREFPLTCGRIQMLPQCLGEWYEEKMGVSSPLG